MSSLHHEALLEDCYEKADAIEKNARQIFEDLCQ